MKIYETYKQTKYNVTYSPKRKVSYIVIHNTGTTASAQNNCKYFGGGNRNASADYFVNPDGSIYLFNGDIKNYYSWHCGDGKGKYGITNANSVSIECVSAGTEFSKAQTTALRELVNSLMAQFNVPKNNVVRHYDASRKSCPAYYVNTTRWGILKDAITLAPTPTPTPTPSQPTSGSFLVKIKCDVLNIRAGAGVSFKVVGSVKKNEVYTIVETSGTWGKLKSGAGWISISNTYVTRV